MRKRHIAIQFENVLCVPQYVSAGEQTDGINGQPMGGAVEFLTRLATDNRIKMITILVPDMFSFDQVHDWLLANGLHKDHINKIEVSNRWQRFDTTLIDCNIPPWGAWPLNDELIRQQPWTRHDTDRQTGTRVFA